MAENNVDSVVVGLATKVVITALSGIAAKGFSFINDDIKYKNMMIELGKCYRYLSDY